MKFLVSPLYLFLIPQGDKKKENPTPKPTLKPKTETPPAKIQKPTESDNATQKKNDSKKADNSTVAVVKPTKPLDISDLKLVNDSIPMTVENGKFRVHVSLYILYIFLRETLELDVQNTGIINRHDSFQIFVNQRPAI